MIKFLSLFSGIGAFESALKNLGIDFEVVNYCEIDKFASKSYSMIHDIPETKNLKDVTEVTEWDVLDKVDLITYGFPCQDISLAGKQKGLINEDGSLTRSGLFFKALDIIKWYKPKIAIAENVKNLTSKKFAEQFRIVLDSLDEAGYNCYWKVLNAKDYGIPQNRERVFIISIRKDIDNGSFNFPEPMPLELRLKDMLEDEVDEKYYLSEKMFNYVLDVNGTQKGTAWDGRADNDTLNSKVAHTISVRGATGCQRAGVSNFIVDGLDEEIKVKDFKIMVMGNYSPSGHDASRIVHPDGIAPTVKENHGTVTAVTENLKVRKLTPRECFRLMGFKDEEFNKIIGISNAQLYKQAGNSIVVNVLEAIFKNIHETRILT